LALAEGYATETNIILFIVEACKLVPVMGHFCGKFEALTDWQDVLIGLFCYVVKYKYINFHSRKTNTKVDF